MKKRLVLKCILLFISILFVSNGFAQDTVQWHLPEGAKARIGKGRANDIALSPDGTQLAVATGIGVWLYNTGTGAEIALLTGHTDRVNSVAYSPNGKTVATASYREIHLWDPSTQEQKTTFEHMGKRITGVFSKWSNARCRTVARCGCIGCSDGESELSLSGHTSGVRLLEFSSNGRTLATAARSSQDKAIRLWNPRTGKLLRKLEHPEGINSMSLSPDGSTLVSGSWDGKIRLWNTRTGRNTKTLDMRSDAVAYSPDGSKIAVATDKIRLLNARTGQLQQTLSGHSNGIYRMIFSSDGSTLVSASWDGTIRLWNASTGSHRLTIEEHFYFRSSALSPNGKTIATTSDDGIFLWNASNGKFTKAFDVGIRSGVIAYSPDGNTLAIESWNDGPQIQLLNARTGRVKKRFAIKADLPVL